MKIQGDWPTPEEFQDIIYQKKDGVAKVTINKPDKMNAMTTLTFRELVVAFRDAGDDPTIGVIVLTGAGDRAFSSGGDVEWERESKGKRLPGGGFPDLHEAMRRCLKPIIAAVRGYAIGGGNHLAYHCDLTIAADNAIFGQVGPRVGSPADGYMVNYLIHVVGEKKARELWYCCRKYTAQEALDMGLINKVVPLKDLDAEVDKWCKDILAGSPTCLRILKATFELATDHLRNNTYYMKELMAPGFAATEEAREGSKAFLEKRRPDYNKFRKPS